MSNLRFLPMLLILLAVQAGLWSALSALFFPRPEQRAQRRKLAIALAALALFFIGFMAAARSGVQPPAALREFFVEPLLAMEVLSIPLMLALGLSLSVARRLPATGLISATGAAAVLGIEQAELAPQLSRHDVPIRGLHPDLDGITIVQLSDIHAGALMSEERMLRIARAAAALQPDLVVLTGDLLDVSPAAAAPFSRAFGELRGKLGTFAIFGNHDYYAGPRAAEQAVRDAGATLLRNSGARIERGRGSLFIGGVDDPSRGSLGLDPARALRAAAPEEPRIMLAHRPSLFELCASAGAQLVLSVARVLGPYTMGLYERQGAHLFVHRGMGTVGPMPVRLGSPPEIALLTLRRV